MKPKRRSWLYAGAILLAIGGATLWGFRDRHAVEQVRHDLEIALPVGSSREQVESTLVHYFGSTRWAANEGAFLAGRRDVQPGLLVRQDVVVRALMDDRSRLKSIVVRAVYTGL